jgi:DNA ligase-1
VGSSSPSPGAAGTSPALLLAAKWTAETDPEGWWLSEKLDGLRAYWNGTEFLSRNGNIFYAPDWFKVQLPRFPLDGELWLDRQKFQKTMSIVRSHNGGDRWKALKYVVFDAPREGGDFEARMKLLGEWFGDERCDHARLHPHELCKGVDHLKAELDRVLALQGEGLMLRKPGSSYEGRRSSTLLKVKKFIEAEAVVVDHNPGKGKHRGRMGGLVVEMPDGKRFNIGVFEGPESIRDNPPAIGETITYRFTEHTKAGIPKCASYVRPRKPE